MYQEYQYSPVVHPYSRIHYPHTYQGSMSMRHVSKLLTGWIHHAQHRDEGPHCSSREARRIVRHVRVRAGYARVLCSWAKVDGPGGRSNATLCCRPVGKWPVACGLSPFCTSAYPAACCLQYRYGRRKDGWPGDCVCLRTTGRRSCAAFDVHVRTWCTT